MKNKEKLYLSEEMDEILGGYCYHVISIPISPDGSANEYDHRGYVLRENCQTEKHALACVKQRIREGYRVDIFKYIGVSANG